MNGSQIVGVALGVFLLISGSYAAFRPEESYRKSAEWANIFWRINPAAAPRYPLYGPGAKWGIRIQCLFGILFMVLGLSTIVYSLFRDPVGEPYSSPHRSSRRLEPLLEKHEVALRRLVPRPDLNRRVGWNPSC